MPDRDPEGALLIRGYRPAEVLVTSYKTVSNRAVGSSGRGVWKTSVVSGVGLPNSPL